MRTARTFLLLSLLKLMELHFSFSHLTFLVAFLLFLYSLAKEVTKSISHGSKNKKLPPGPWKLPFIGNLLQLTGALPHHALSDLAKKHGGLMHLKLGEISVLVISSSRMAEEVMKTHDVSFASRPKLVSTDILTYNYKDVAFCPYGEYWKEMRKFCTMELFSAKRVKSFQHIRDDEVLQMIESVQSESETSSAVNLSEKIYSLMNQITCRATTGTNYKHQDKLLELLNQVTSVTAGLDVADMFPSFKFLHVLSGVSAKMSKLTGKLDKIFEDIISEKLSKTTRNKDNGDPDDYEDDLLAILLRQHVSSSLKFSITSNNIKAILLDVLTGGTDTAAITIEWTMSELIRKPKTLKKAQEEVRDSVKGKRRVQQNDIQGMTYLKQVIKETMRLHPPLPMLLPKECIQECQIDGYNIPVKTMVMVNAWAIGRDPNYWDDAEEFKPERFDNMSVDDLNGTNFNILPFGAGRRVCPGITFAFASVGLALAELLYHFDWKLPNGMKPDDLDMTENFGTTTSRKHPLLLIAQPRTPLRDGL